MSPLFVELPEVDSTNSFLVSPPEGFRSCDGVFSWNQTGGRGRSGRQWLSRAGETLAFSLALPTARCEEAGSWLPLLAGHVLCLLLRERGVPGAGVKWPNDILVGGAKLSGVLVEKHPSIVVVGVGINILGSPMVGNDVATTSLREQGWQPEDVVSDIIEPVFHGINHLLGSGQSEEKELRWRQVVTETLGTIGKMVEFRDQQGHVRNGVAVNLGTDGALVVDVPGEHQHVMVHAGDVFHIERS